MVPRRVRMQGGPVDSATDAESTWMRSEHLFRMLGMLQDPVTGEQLGRPPRRGRPAYLDARGATRRAPLPVAGFD